MSTENTTQDSPLDKAIEAIRNGKLDSNAKIDGVPVLSMALADKNLTVAKELIDMGANVNAYADRPAVERGMAPVHFANSPDAIALLASAKADLNAPYKDVDHAWGMRGETALHTASLGKTGNDLAMSEALIKYGANPNIPFSKKEFSYGNDSMVSGDDIVIRGNSTISSRLNETRRVDKELNELLSDTPSVSIEKKIAPEQITPEQINFDYVGKIIQIPVADFKKTVINPDDLNIERSSLFNLKSSVDQSEKLKDETEKFLKQKFLIAGNDKSGIEYHFKDKSDPKTSLAFLDKNSTLTTKHNDPAVIDSMLKVAESRGWASIELKGTEEFKREAWIKASSQGFEVTGYKPSDLDIDRMKAERDFINKNHVAQSTVKGGSIIDTNASKELPTSEQNQKFSNSTKAYATSKEFFEILNTVSNEFKKHGFPVDEKFNKLISDHILNEHSKGVKFEKGVEIAKPIERPLQIVRGLEQDKGIDRTTSHDIGRTR